jgi:hypothetical protein
VADAGCSGAEWCQPDQIDEIDIARYLDGAAAATS